MNKKPLICILGRTGSGKSTLAEALCQRYGLQQLRSYTTRSMRPGEEIKSDHIFITPDEVSKYQEQIVAYTKIGNYECFGTLDIVDGSDVYVIDPIGIASLRRSIKDRPIYEIYVQTLSTEKHLDVRKDTPQDRMDRISAEKTQFDAYEILKPWDYLIDNSGDLNDAIQSICDAYRTIQMSQCN